MKIVIKYVVCAFLFIALYFPTASGQIDVSYTGYPQLIIKLTDSFRQTNFVGIEAAIGEDYGNRHNILSGYGGGAQYQLNGNRTIRIYGFYERGLVMFLWRISADFWINKSILGLSCTPEIGITLFSYFDFTYGYSIPLTNNFISNDLSRSCFNLRLTVFLRSFSKGH